MSTSRFIALSLAAVAILLPGRAAGVAQRQPQPPVSVSCTACLVVDDSGTVLWARRAEEPVAIASATKMVTALAVRAHAELTDEVTVSEGAAATPGGRLSLIAGEILSVEELLYGMLMNSSNDAAVALAEHVAGSEGAFAALMNDQARSSGAASSNFTTAHGLDEPGHHSTAADLVAIAADLLSDPLLAGIVRTARYEIESSARRVELENTNLLLEAYPGMIGVKTGFTSDAGNVLVSAATRKGRRVIAVALGAQGHFADSRALLDYGFERLRRTVIVERGRALGLLLFDGHGSALVTTTRPIRGLEVADSVSVGFTATPGITLPVGRGDVVGTAEVRSGTRVLAKVDGMVAGRVAAAESSWVGRALAGILRIAATTLPGEGR